MESYRDAVDHFSPAYKVELASFMLICYGLVTLALLWVPVLVLDHVGVEVFESPDDTTVYVLICNAILDAAFNGFLLVGILMATPLFMSVGSMMVR